MDTTIHISESRSYKEYIYAENCVLSIWNHDGDAKYSFQSWQREGNRLFIAQNDKTMRIEYIPGSSALPVRFDILATAGTETYRVYWEK